MTATFDADRLPHEVNDGDPTPRHGGSDDGMAVISYILSGLLLYGGLGWLADRWLETTWLLPVGLILGLLASMYLIFKRYGGLK